MAERTADPEKSLRRFTRSNIQHPTYKALAELDKATKTASSAATLARRRCGARSMKG
jgi:TnpA family transposase